MTVYGSYPAEKDFIIYKQTREEWEQKKQLLIFKN